MNIIYLLHDHPIELLNLLRGSRYHHLGILVVVDMKKPLCLGHLQIPVNDTRNYASSKSNGKRGQKPKGGKVI